MVTKRRLLNNFEDNMYIASLGASPTFKSDVKRFMRDAMSPNAMTEMEKPEYEKVGPGAYRWAEQMDAKPYRYLPEAYLSEKPRFMIDACSAERFTELMLPGTEHIGPGKYEHWKRPKIPGPNPMKNREPRSYIYDSRTILPEGMKSPHRAGDVFVPQYHLFWGEDGSCKISENIAVLFPKADRFGSDPMVKEMHERARLQPDLPGLDVRFDMLSKSKR